MITKRNKNIVTEIGFHFDWNKSGSKSLNRKKQTKEGQNDGQMYYVLNMF
jgi:hypothetical protein